MSLLQQMELLDKSDKGTRAADIWCLAMQMNQQLISWGQIRSGEVRQAILPQKHGKSLVCISGRWHTEMSVSRQCSKKFSTQCSSCPSKCLGAFKVSLSWSSDCQNWVYVHVRNAGLSRHHTRWENWLTLSSQRLLSLFQHALYIVHSARHLSVKNTEIIPIIPTLMFTSLLLINNLHIIMPHISLVM